ncbi:MAG: hypothetical protein WC951_03670 [Bacteroidales bacterium]
MIKRILLLSIFVFSVVAVSAKIKISGKVQDEETGLSLAYCHVKVTSNSYKSYAIADNYGNFILLIPEEINELNIDISCVGYISLTQPLYVYNDTVLTFNLKPDQINISEVRVLSRKAQQRGLNEYYLTPKDASVSATVMGEVDIIKQLQVLPGVTQGMDGTLGMFVRGGNNGNNRIELDGIPIYGNTHLFGLTSVFQADIIQDITFKMGGISAQKGNFLSSVTQVQTKDALKSSGGSISVSPFIIGGHTQFSLADKTFGVLLGGRYSLLNQEFKLIQKSLGGEGTFTPQVADGLLKLSWKIDTTQSVNLLAFATNDYLYYKNESGIAQNWDNTVFKLEWEKFFNPTASLNTMAYYNQFRNVQEQKSYDLSDGLVNGLLLSSKVKDVVFKSELTKQYNELRLSTGLSFQYTEFSPASQKVVVSSNKTEDFSSNLNSILTGAYISINHKLPGDIFYQAGVRTYYYQSGSYSNVFADVRLMADYVIARNFGVEISYDHFSQFFQVLEGLPTGWSLDLMIPASGSCKPSQSDQFYSGFFWILNQFRFNLGGYWKSLTNLVSYKNNVNLFGANNATFHDELESGKGKSYGLEFMANKKGNKWSWNFAYTLSKTTRTYPTINGGNSYPFKFDRRHILNFQTNYITVNKGKRKQNVFASIAFSSGHKATLAVGEYLGVTLPYWEQSDGGVFISSEMNHQAYHRQLMSPKNSYTMPNYLRFDLGYTFIRLRRSFEREFTVSAFNVTNHKNPYLYFNESNKWYQLTIFPIMPSFRYSLRF